MASFGENLRRERELRRVALQDIAQATKISVRFLQALEADRIEILPGGIFRRAFVREYARYVGLDAERTVADFLAAHEPVVAEPAPSQPAPRGGHRRLVLGVAAIAAAGALTWAARRDAAPSAALPAPAAVVSTSDPLLPPSDVSSPGQAGSERGARAEGARDGLIVVTLRANETCWTRARTDGRVVLEREIAGGEIETLQASERIVLDVGNAGGLALRINDRPALPLGRRGEVLRNIVITRDSLSSLVVEDAPQTRAAHSG